MNTRTQFIRFLLVGILSAGVDLSVTLVGQYFMGCQPDMAKALGFVAGTTVAFAINRIWTFQAVLSIKNISSVAVLYGVTFGIQEIIYSSLSQVLPQKIEFSIMIFCLAQGSATIVNFVVQKYVIFRHAVTKEGASMMHEVPVTEIF